MSQKSRTKGHNFERQVAIAFREVGYDAYTARSASKRIDNCGIDILNTPFLIQCKAGYSRNRLDFRKEHAYATEQMQQFFKKDFKKLSAFPIVLIQKHDVGRGNKRKKEDITVTLSFDDFMNIIQKLAVKDESFRDTVVSLIS